MNKGDATRRLLWIYADT